MNQRKRPMKISIFYLFSGIFFFTFLTGCAHEQAPVTVGGTVSIFDLASERGVIPAEGAQVILQADTNGNGEIGDEEIFKTVADAGGNYLIETSFRADYRWKLVLIMKQDGFSTLMKTLPAGEGNYQVSGVLRPAEIATCADGSCTVPSHKIIIENLPEEVAEGQMRVFNPATESEYFPGNYEDDQGNLLISTSFSEVELYDSSGQAITEAEEGEPFKVRMFVPRDTWRTLSDLHPETSQIEIPMYYFDEKKGTWVEDGEGILVYEGGQPISKEDFANIQNGTFSGNVYGSFDASHMSYWNIDWKMPDYTCFMGRLLDGDQPVTYAVIQAEGITYDSSGLEINTLWRDAETGMNSGGDMLINRTTSDADGWFVVAVKRSDGTITHRSEITDTYQGETGLLGQFDNPTTYSPYREGNAFCYPPDCPCTNLGDLDIHHDIGSANLCEVYGVVKYSGYGIVTGGAGLAPPIGTPIAGVTVNAIDYTMDSDRRDEVCTSEEGENICQPSATSDEDGLFHIVYGYEVNALLEGTAVFEEDSYTEGYEGQATIERCPSTSPSNPLILEVNYSYHRPGGYPNAPEGVTSTASCGEVVNLTWIDRAADEDAFRIDRKQGTDGTWQILANLPADTTSHPDTTTRKNTEYCYRVAAFRSLEGNLLESPSLEYCMTTPDTHCGPPPPSPANLGGDALPTAVTLSWEDKDREDGYKVVKREIISGPCSEGGDSLDWETVYRMGYIEIGSAERDTLTFSDTSITPGSCVCYRVFAYNSGGNSGSSNPACMTVPYCVENNTKSFYTGLPGTEGVGTCLAGRETCIGGVWAVTQTDVTPTNEACDDLDNDCDGMIDEGVKATFYRDADADGHGDPESALPACSAPEGYVTGNSDCDDADPAVYDGNGEICDGKDNDCDGSTDEGVTTTYYQDSDGDGFGDLNNTAKACSLPEGYAENHDDCDDSNENINPEAVEVCDGTVDDNCNSAVDEGCTCINGEELQCGTTDVGECEFGTQTCVDGTWGECLGAVIPVAETCDGLDNDCNGDIDNGVLNTYYVDADDDGYGYSDATTLACIMPEGYEENSLDCDDEDPEIHPGAEEIPDEIDNNCNGQIDEDAVKWTYQTGNAIESSPAIGINGTIYIGSFDQKIYAVYPDGTTAWSIPTGGAIFSSPAAVTDGVLDTRLYIGSDDSRLYAVDPTAATVAWSAFSPPWSAAVESSPAIGADGTIWVGADDTWIHGFESDGSVKWSYDTGGYVISSPAIAGDGTVYAGSNDFKLYALDPVVEILDWSYGTGDWVRSSPAIGADGTIYFGSDEGGLYSLNPDGSLNWYHELEAGIPVFSSPAIDSDGTVYIGSDNGILYAINPDNTEKWTYATGGWVRSTPAIGADGIIYFGSGDGYVYALNPDGSLLWDIPTGGPVRSSPAIGEDGTIYVGSGDGMLYAINGTGAGLCTACPWPMFRHDLLHSGRAD